METRYDDYVNAQSERIIERLAFPAGGSRYVFLFGVYAALAKANLLETVTQVAGTSAGSMIATMIALGADVNDIYKKYSQINLFHLFGERVGLLWGNSQGITPLTYDGKPLISTLRSIIVDIMQDFFASTETQSILANDAELNELALRFQESTATLSFRDLAMLHQLFPLRFKQVFYDTVIYPSGESYIINMQSNHYDIAEGCYASGAIPAVFMPIEIDNRRLIDGGIYRQTPIDAFDYPSSNQKPANTLAFIFSDPPYDDYEQNSSFKTLHRDQATIDFYNPSALEKFLRNKLLPYAIGLEADYQNTYSWNDNYSHLAKHYSLNTVIINTCGLSPGNFSQAIKFSRQFYTSGFLDTMNYLTNHELYLSECETKEFYDDLMKMFESIYEAIFLGWGSDLKKDAFWLDYQNYKNDNTAQNRCSFVHDYLKKNVESHIAMILSFAVEFNNDVLTAEELYKDVYQYALNNHVSSLSKPLGSFFNSYYSNNKATKNFEDENDVLNYLRQIPKFVMNYQVDSCCQPDSQPHSQIL